MLTMEFGEEIVIKKTFLQVVRKERGRPCAGSNLSVWKPVCGSMCEEQNVDVFVPLRVRGVASASISGRGSRGGFGPG